LAVSASLAAELRCQMCGDIISGNYYVAADGSKYCESCWRKNFVCDICGKLVKSVVKLDDHNFCASCYAKLDVCDYCGNPLVGAFTQYQGLDLKVCPDCDKNLPRCQGCGIPVKNPIVKGQILLCERCAAKVDHCHSCGDPLLKDYSFFEGNQALKFCLSCTRNYPRCDDCGAPIGPNGTTLADNRHLCPDCSRVAYFQPGLVTPIKERVFNFVKNNMKMTIKHDIAFSLEDRNFLNSKATDIHGDLNGLFHRKGEDFSIYVLYGLREKDLITVIAHEIAHVWQSENCSDNMALEDQEGFAQWVAYKALCYYSMVDFARLMTEGDTVYSTGLVKMLEIENKNGASGVFSFMTRGK
jgi:hypothetical protein